MSARPPARRRRSLSSSSPASSSQPGPSTSSTRRAPPRRSPRRAAPGPEPESDAPRYSPLPFNREGAREDQPPTSSTRSPPPTASSDDHRPSQVTRNLPRRHSLRYDPVTDAIETQTQSQHGVPLAEHQASEPQTPASAIRSWNALVSVPEPHQAGKGGGGQDGRSRKSPSPRAGGEATAVRRWRAGHGEEGEDDIYPSSKRRRLSDLADDEPSGPSKSARERLVEFAYRPDSEASLEDAEQGELPFKESSPLNASTPSQSPSSLAPSLEDQSISVGAIPFIPGSVRPTTPERPPPAATQPGVPFLPPAPPPLEHSPVVSRAYYPAYNANGDRIGLDRTLEENTPGTGAARHYRKKTLRYPPPGDEFPHVMNIDIDTVPQDPSPPRPKRKKPNPRTSKAKAKRTSPPPSQASPELASPQQDSGLEHDSASIPEDEPDEPEEAEATEEDQTSEGPPDTEQLLREELELKEDVEINLYTLDDPGPTERPNYVYTVLIKLAIWGSPKKRLTLGEIYQALEERFQWFRENTHDLSWKNSIRHRLSLCKCFQRVSRPITEPGKGSFWTIDFSQGEGNKRPRKRNKKPTKAELAAMERESRGQESEEEAPQNPRAPKPRASQRQPPKEKPWIITTPGPTAPVPSNVPQPAPSVPQPISSGRQRTFSVPQPSQPPVFDISMLDPLLRDPAPALLPPPLLPSGHDVGSGQTPRTTKRGARKGASPYQQSDDFQGARTRSRTSSGPEQSASPPAFSPVAGPSHVFGQPAFGQPGTGHYRVPSTASSTSWLPYASGSNAVPSISSVTAFSSAPAVNMLGLSGSASQISASSSAPTARREPPESFRRTSEVRMPQGKRPARKLTTDQDGNLVRTSSYSGNLDDDDDYDDL